MGLGILLSVFLTACLSTFTVDINLDADGSGEVRFSVSFDGATLSKYPELLDFINLKDLEAGDWQVIETEGSQHKISVTKRFANEAQIQTLLDEISPGAFAIKAKRLEEDGKSEITLNGELDIALFRNNLLAGSNIDISGLPPEASRIEISTQINTADDFAIKNWETSLTSNEILKLNNTFDAAKNKNRFWLWVSIAAFSLLGMTLTVNFLGWVYQKRQKNHSNLKLSVKPRKFR